MVEEPEAPEDREVLVEPNETARPEGMEYAERVTVPEKPFRLVSWITALADDPTGMVSCEGVIAMLKPLTVMDRETEWDSPPLIPVMLMA